MIKPTVHMNGTSRASLSLDYEEAYTAVGTAIRALENIDLHARDYHVQGPDAFRQAVDEHQDRMARLMSVKKELMEIFESVFY